MNTKIRPLLLLLIIPPLMGLAGAEEVVAVQRKPDFDNPETLEKILTEALLMDTLEKRGPEGAELFYTPDSQTPHTGWVKMLHANGTAALLGALKGGKSEGLWTWWHENGVKMTEITCKNGKPEGPITAWHKNGKKVGEGTYKNGKLDGPYTMWDESGQKAGELTYKDGELVDHRSRKRFADLGELTSSDEELLLNAGPFTRWLENSKKKEQGTFKDGNQVFENEPDLDDAETLKKILGTALSWDTLKKDAQSGLYHAPQTQQPYTGWFKKLHGNGKVALLGALKDGEPAGLWTWWDGSGLKEDEKRHTATTP